jgi:hypothetical protein
MSPLYLPVGSVITLNSNIKLSEHNRQPVSIGQNRIEKTQRMGNGTLRKFYITDKETISLSWNKLPSFSTFTVDGGYGAVDLENFYNGTAAKATGALSGQSSFDVTITYGGQSRTLEMVFQSFSADIVNRNVKQKSSDSPQEFWDVSISLMEV